MSCAAIFWAYILRRIIFLTTDAGGRAVSSLCSHCPHCPHYALTMLSLSSLSSLCPHCRHYALTMRSFSSLSSLCPHCRHYALTMLSLSSLCPHSPHCALTVSTILSLCPHSPHCVLTLLTVSHYALSLLTVLLPSAVKARQPLSGPGADLAELALVAAYNLAQMLCNYWVCTHAVQLVVCTCQQLVCTCQPIILSGLPGEVSWDGYAAHLIYATFVATATGTSIAVCYWHCDQRKHRHKIRSD